ncbi:MAG: hypothetical protein FWD31_07040 [Planctomycetaceae bacterium]|nr:hypothetical protein [Planctomycetaceae bacterium]
MFFHSISRFSVSFFVATVNVLCCLYVCLVLDTTWLAADDEIFELWRDQQSAYPFQITQDGRLVMFDPAKNRFEPTTQTSHFAQTSHSLYNERYNESAALPQTQYLAQSSVRSGEARRGMFQGASVGFSYLPGLGSHGFEMTQVRFGAAFGLPAPLKNSFILLSPSFEPTFVRWDGPEPFPDVLYSASLNCTLIKKFNDRWSAMANVGPRWSSDGKETKNAVRSSLMAGMTWNQSRQWQFRFGVVYLNRSDSFNILPFGGAVWTPNEDWRLELMAPMLRVAKRCHLFQTVLPHVSESNHWRYFGIGFGGGTWAFQSVGKQPDVANYSEFSVVVGLESKRMERTPWKAELGYVFGRSMNFENNTMRKFSIGDTIVLRMTLAI